MKSNLLLFFSFLFAFSIEAQNTNIFFSADPNEVRFIKESKTVDLNQQAFLRSSEAWQSFKSAHAGWNVRFNESSAMPHRAFGSPIQLSASSQVDAAEQFIQNELAPFGIDQLDLNFAGQTTNSKHAWINYQQKHEGLDVLWSRLTVKVTPYYEIIMFGADIFTDIELSTIPGIDHAEALEAAKEGLNNITAESIEQDLAILPIEVNGDYTFHLVYQAEVSIMDAFQVPGRYFTIVDAQSGEVLYRQNQVHSCGPECDHDIADNLAVNVQITGTGFLEDASQPEEVLNMPNIEVEIDGMTYNADELGNLVTSETGPIDASIRLEGLWSRIVNNISNDTPNFDITLMEGDNEVSVDNDANINEISAYHSVNVIHDYMKSQLPTFTGMDIQLTTNVDINEQTCNAFYDGSSINFYVDLNNGTCVSLAKIADVVYHEYGHGINNTFYINLGSNFQNGGMNEGYADVWAFAPNEDPVLGNGLNPNNANEFVRRYDEDPKVYPEDLVG
ncbi:MAG: hypothetical protein AAF487_11870, partial [Bacteroidota bacterium]